MTMPTFINVPPAAPMTRPSMKMITHAFEQKFTTGTNALRNLMKA